VTADDPAARVSVRVMGTPRPRFLDRTRVGVALSTIWSS
jgi:hypothetical protein